MRQRFSASHHSFPLPCRETRETRSGERRGVTHDTEARTILLVDDNPIVKKTTAMNLEDDGYHVVTAFTGDEAVEINRSDAGIDLVLMAIDPGSGMNGAPGGRDNL